MEKDTQEGIEFWRRQISQGEMTLPASAVCQNVLD